MQCQRFIDLIFSIWLINDPTQKQNSLPMVGTKKTSVVYIYRIWICKPIFILKHNNLASNHIKMYHITSIQIDLSHYVIIHLGLSNRIYFILFSA